MKQLKSTSVDLRSLFEESITVKYVAEPLKAVSADEGATVVRQWMETHYFDVVGVEDTGVICGYVERDRLAGGRCGDYQRIFHPSELIADSTPLMQLLRILRHKPRIFVLERDRVSGIVTRGDLQKAPVRMLLFGLVTLLEMQLLRLVRIYYPQDSWLPFLKGERVVLAKKLWQERQARNEAIDLTDYLQFSDKRELILAKTEIVERLGLRSKRSGERFLKLAEALRNKLAHAQDLVSDSSWPELILLAGEIETLLQRCEEIEQITAAERPSSENLSC